MFYSEAGQLPTDHLASARTFRLRQERVEVGMLLLLAFGAVPAFGDDYWLTATLIPFLILALAGLGQNLLTASPGSSRSAARRSWRWARTRRIT